MDEITLAEAYRRRDSIAASSLGIYCKGGDTGATHRLVFAVRQPGGGWYNVWLATDVEAALVSMQANARVYLAQVTPDQARMIFSDGQDLPLSA